jgi:hypothetical protein
VTISDISSLVAVALSFLSIVATIFIYINQKKYISTQNKLNELLLQKEKAELDSSTEGDVSANVVHIGTNHYRIRVFNKGGGRADNVSIEYPEEHDWMIMDDVLPIDFLDSGQGVDIKLALFAGCKSKIKAILHWDDVKGKRQKEIILTR